MTNPQSNNEIHYSKLGQNYDFLWGYQEQYASKLISDIQESLQISQKDIVSDLGGGTGFWTEKIAQQLKPNMIFCVDPCEPMIKEANNKIGIIPKCQPVLEFIKNCPFTVTKVFIKAAIHHFENRVEVLTEIYRLLTSGGKCLIITLSNNCEDLPLFSKALSFVKDMPNFFSTLIDEIKQTKFSFTIQEKNYEANVTKNNWFDMLRGRFISTLNVFSDSDIEEGVKELKHSLNERKVTIPMNYFFITLEK